MSAHKAGYPMYTMICVHAMVCTVESVLRKEFPCHYVINACGIFRRIHTILRVSNLLCILGQQTQVAWVADSSLKTDRKGNVRSWIAGYSVSHTICTFLCFASFCLYHNCQQNHTITLSMLFCTDSLTNLCSWIHVVIQWNLSITTTSIMKFVICDLFSNMFLMKTEGINLLLLKNSAF